MMAQFFNSKDEAPLSSWPNFDNTCKLDKIATFDTLDVLHLDLTEL